MIWYVILYLLVGLLVARCVPHDYAADAVGVLFLWPFTLLVLGLIALAMGLRWLVTAGQEGMK